MDPNSYFNFYFGGFSPFASQLYPALASEAGQNSNPIEDPSTQKKYHRTWKKSQVEEVFGLTSQYCLQNNKTIENLKLKDFEIIAKGTIQTPDQVMMKINEITKSGTLRPGIWSEPEDEMLKNLLNRGIEKWGQIANIVNKEYHKGLKIRTGKQCKERWNNYLNPEINRGEWSDKEDIVLLEKYLVYGNKWSVISKFIKKRTESSVKNRIKSLLNKIKQDLNAMDDLNQGVERAIQQRKIMMEKEVVKSDDESNPNTKQENYKD